MSIIFSDVCRQLLVCGNGVNTFGSTFCEKWLKLKFEWLSYGNENWVRWESTILRFRQYKNGLLIKLVRTLLRDDERPRRSRTAKSYGIVSHDHWLKVRELAGIANVSIDHIQYILQDVLGMKKLRARWMPDLLIVDQKRLRMKTSQEYLDFFKRNPAEFLRRFITVDKSWIHRYRSETKQ